MEYCGFASGRLGSDNQTRGLILEASANQKVPVTRNRMIQGENGEFLDRSAFNDDASFKKAVFSALDAYLKSNAKPDVCVLPFNHGDMENAGKNTDLLAGTIKDYYKENNLGDVTTMVLTSAYYDYKNADIAHVPYHLMTEEQAKAVGEGKTGSACKIVPTLGVAGNLTKVRINQEANSPKFADELKAFDNGKPTAFFSLGGRVEGSEIKFTMKDAENLWAKALTACKDRSRSRRDFPSSSSPLRQTGHRSWRRSSADLRSRNDCISIQSRRSDRADIPADTPW